MSSVENDYQLYKSKVEYRNRVLSELGHRLNKEPVLSKKEFLVKRINVRNGQLKDLEKALYNELKELKQLYEELDRVEAEENLVT